MASRENQGLHIALILLVMLTVGLCVLSFVFYSKSETLRSEAEDARNKMETAKSDLSKALFKSQTLNEMLTGQSKSMTQIADQMANIPGSDTDDPEMKKIRRNFANNMMLFGPANEEVESARNYQSLPDFLLSRIRDLNQQLTDLRRTENQLTQEKASIEAAANTRIKKAETDRDAARNDLASERDKFTKDLAEVRKQMETIAGQATEKDNRIVELNTQLEDVRSAFNKRIEQLAKTVDDQRNLLRTLRETTFETPDAIVTTVNGKEGVIYINAGSEDNLKAQQTFSVFDKGTTAVMKAKPKGRVEVIQVLGAHVAMCRILNDDVANIIVPDDLLFTPAWSPGDRIHFAITGFIDITDSGQNDAGLLAKLIELNGGVVDDEVTVQTRYLVQGENRTSKANGDADNELKDDFDKKLAAAVEIGVDRLSPDKLLALMGWRADVTTVTLGTGKATDAKGAKTEAPADERFRKRTPPRGADGAF